MKRAAIRAIAPLALPCLCLLTHWPGALLATVAAVAASFIADVRGRPVMAIAPVRLKTWISEATQVDARATLLLSAEVLFLAIFIFLSLGGMK